LKPHGFIGIVYFVIAVNTSKNTICILGSKNGVYSLCELYAYIDHDESIRLSYRYIDATSIINNDGLKSISNLLSYNSVKVGRYTFMNLSGNTIYYSDNINTWHTGYETDNNIIGFAYDGTNLIVIE